MVDEPTNITLLPEEDAPSDPEQDLLTAEDAIDDLPESSVDLVVTGERPPIGRGFAFDPNSGFVRSSTGRGVLQTQGIETLRTWITKCLNTERGAHPIYSDDYGLEGAFDLIGSAVASVEVADYERRVKDALLYHPRITDVADFVAQVDPALDYVLCSFTVRVDDDESLTVQVGIR